MIKREFFYLPEEGGLPINGNTVHKVSQSGDLRPFYGNTVIYDLPEDDKRHVKKLQDILYRHCEDFMSIPLTEESFHVTLHDLRNGTDRHAVTDEVRKIETRAKNLVEQLKGKLHTPIPMKPVKAVNMVSSSVVLLLEPKYAIHKQLLDLAYDVMQNAVELSYGLTPHITLGYYRPMGDTPETAGSLSEDALDRLHDAMEQILEHTDFIVTLDPKKLHYTEFTDMNNYGTNLL